MPELLMIEFKEQIKRLLIVTHDTLAKPYPIFEATNQQDLARNAKYKILYTCTFDEWLGDDSVRLQIQYIESSSGYFYSAVKHSHHKGDIYTPHRISFYTGESEDSAFKAYYNLEYCNTYPAYNWV